MSHPELETVPNKLTETGPLPEKEQPIPVIHDRRTGDIWLVLLIVSVPAIFYAFADLIWSDIRPVHPPIAYSAIHTLVMLAGEVGLIVFLLHRSGRSFARYGLGRPSWAIDPVLVVVLAIIALLIERFVQSILPGIVGPYGNSNWHEYFPLPPQRGWDYALVGLEMMAIGFAEELVWRSYLVTRIEEVTGSRI